MPKYKVPRARKYNLIAISWNGKSETLPLTRQIHGVFFRKMWSCGYQDYTQSVYLQSEWDRVEKLVLKKIVADKKYIPSVYSKQKRAGESLVNFSKKIQSADFKNLSLRQLLKLSFKLQESWIKIDALNVMPWFLGGERMQQKVSHDLRKLGLEQEEIEEMLLPKKLSFSSEEEMAILKIAKEVMKNKVDIRSKKFSPKILKLVDALVKKYYWIPFGYDGPDVYDREYYLKAIDQLLETRSSENIVKRILFLENYEAAKNKVQQKIIKQHKIPAEIIRHIKANHVLHLMTDERKAFQFPAHVALSKILEEIACKTKIDQKYLSYLIIEEIDKFIQNPAMLEKIAQERMKNPFSVLWKKGKPKALSKAEARKMREEMDADLDANKTIQGSIGCKGKEKYVRGTVAILFKAAEIKKMKESSILVAPMTTPEFVPAMRRALAIITDEGGVTCHAAIVSRELGIPCIIGTKVVTRMLKDGDRVEMDMEKGLVRIIK